jgi:hypothetical protein
MLRMQRDTRRQTCATGTYGLSFEVVQTGTPSAVLTETIMDGLHRSWLMVLPLTLVPQLNAIDTTRVPVTPVETSVPATIVVDGYTYRVTLRISHTRGATKQQLDAIALRVVGLLNTVVAIVPKLIQNESLVRASQRPSSSAFRAFTQAEGYPPKSASSFSEAMQDLVGGLSPDDDMMVQFHYVGPRNPGGDYRHGPH